MDQKELAKKIKLIIMDVDGTLSDGRFFMQSDGQEIKSFDVKDGTGIIFAGLAGILVWFSPYALCHACRQSFAVACGRTR